MTLPEDPQASQPPDDAASSEVEVDPALLDTSSYRLTDKQALALLGAYFVFRTITTRVGLALLVGLTSAGYAWVVPLLNNSTLALVTAGISAWDEGPGMLLFALASIVQSTVTGLVLYWAGWRFGPELAKKAEGGKSMWASVWNPQQVAKAHNFLERRGIVAVAVGRIFEVLTTPVALVAGSSRMSLRKFMGAWLVGSAVFVGAALWLGGRIDTQWPWLEDRIQGFADWSVRVGLILLVLLVVAVLLQPKQKASQG